MKRDSSILLLIAASVGSPLELSAATNSATVLAPA